MSEIGDAYLKYMESCRIKGLIEISSEQFTRKYLARAGEIALQGFIDFNQTYCGVLQEWELQASTAATAAGIQRPNDYSASNQRVWIQVS